MQQGRNYETSSLAGRFPRMIFKESTGLGICALTVVASKEPAKITNTFFIFSSFCFKTK